ncbi:hypothetical protein PRZ48_000613 [Zasmidium cellare]|uniref:Uncharacterized protein n=1 Tax=Zasmidium cellare TaxID=395010 RepID=A0ABR0F0M5_ZASCE|nr:hypothetical protein PRZ48_000613 [Zasmidium cellare]
MDTSSTTPTSLGLQAVPREMFHEASWRTTMYNNRQTTANEMAGFGADQPQQAQTPADPETTMTDVDLDDDLDVTAELQQSQPQPRSRCNSFDFVINRANELATQQSGTSNPFDLSLTPQPTTLQPPRAHTTTSLAASSTPYEEIELRDLLTPQPPPTQTRPPQPLTFGQKMWNWCAGVCEAYSEEVMREPVRVVNTPTRTTAWWADGSGPSVPRRAH